MSEEVKKYLDSANFKFKDVDENGIETELTLSEMIEKLVNDNKILSNIIKNNQERINKAIEFINKNKTNVTKEMAKDTRLQIGTFMWNVDKLLDILKGDE